MPAEPKTTKVAKTTATAPAKTAVSNLALGNADDALTLAKELQKFVKENKLTSNIQGKEFPNVEAWQFAGSLLGLSPMLESIEDKSTPDEIKWGATVTLLSTRTNTTVGRGFATCSNKEHSKRLFADYAICSMAQTRAVGKAYRLSLGWLMKAAGYEATPAEEMADLGTSATVVETPKKSSVVAAAPASPPLAASVGAAVNGEMQALRETRAEVVAAEIADLRAAFAETKSTISLKELWEGPAKPYQRELLADKDAAKKRIDAAVRAAASSKAAPVITAPVNRPETDATGVPIVYGTAQQVEELTRLLNHPAITRSEKTTVLVTINRLNAEDMAAEIARFQALIDEREGYARAEGLRRSLVGFAKEHAALIGPGEVDRLTLLAEDATMTPPELQAEMDAARASLEELQAAA